MDYRSGYEWPTLNAILRDNFKELILTGFDTSSWRKFQSLVNIMSSFAHMRVLWSGSIAEGSIMNPHLREGGFEADVMLAPSNFMLTYNDQREMFKHVLEAPGFVSLEITRWERKAVLEMVIGVKEVRKNKCEPSHFFIIPKDETFPNFSNIYDNIPKNFVVQSVLDTLDVQRSCSVQVGYEDPAISAELSVPASVITQLAKPKGLLFKFLGNLGSRFIKHIEGKGAQNVEVDGDSDPTMDDEQAACCRYVSYDYMRTPPITGVGYEPAIGLRADWVPAIECQGWPEIAFPFFQRKRSWPNDDILSKLRQDGFHLVYKPLDQDSDDSVEWRISFSKAEITLFQDMDPVKLNCYRMFKAIFYCELTPPKVLCSYYMKTIFLWFCERIPAEAWVESNLARIIMGLLDDLLHCLVTKSCPHYFIPESNLLAHAHEDFLLLLARKVSEIRTNPQRFPTKRVPLEKPEDRKTKLESSANVKGSSENMPAAAGEIDLD